MSALPRPVQDVREDLRQQLIDDVRGGLLARPKTLPSRWFYDRRGSELFDAITELPEYYLTRTETEILRRHADQIAAITQPQVLVELGAGTSTKTRLLIAAARRCGPLRVFVPLDFDEGVIRQSAATLASDFPGLSVQGIAGDFMHDLDALAQSGRKLVLFLGSTIGNLDDEQRRTFLAKLGRSIRPGDGVLIGFDLVKDPRELVAAYDDSQGVTAEFNLNLLRRLNRELGANFDLDRFRHLAVWNAERSRMESYLQSLDEQGVVLPAAGLWINFEDGERLRTEISVKFTRAAVDRSFREAGLRLQKWITDDRGRFALALGREGRGAQ